jgi:hypothetical protein
MRLFPWLNHPFSYQFNEKRKKIKEYNIERLHYHFNNYKNSFEQLKEETGLILVHINRTNDIKRTVTLVDSIGTPYTVSLDNVTFILQHKAALIYPTLDALMQAHNLDAAKEIVSSVIRLMVNCCQKGFIDDDPVLRKNYGLLGTRAIHIDVGDLIPNEAMKERENYIPHVKEMTLSFRKRIEQNYPALLPQFEQEIEALTLSEKTP